MITSCPSCKTKFDLSGEKVEKGSLVKCSLCGFDWVLSDLNVNKDISHQFERINAKLSQAKKSKKSKGDMSSNFAFIIAFILLFASIAWFAKDTIIRNFPVSQKVYDKIENVIGMLDSEKIDIKVTNVRFEDRGYEREIIIDGIINNNTKEQINKIRLLTKFYGDGVLLKTVPFVLEKVINNNSKQLFRVQLPNPPVGTTGVKIVQQ